MKGASDVSVHRGRDCKGHHEERRKIEGKERKGERWRERRDRISIHSGNYAFFTQFQSV